MKWTVKTDTAMSFTFNQIYKLSNFKFPKIVISFAQKETDRSGE